MSEEYVECKHCGGHGACPRCGGMGEHAPRVIEDFKEIHFTKLCKSLSEYGYYKCTTSDKDLSGSYYPRYVVIDLMNEIERLKRGDFTSEEFQNLCHNSTAENRSLFEQGCKEYQDKIFGCKESK